MPILMLDAMPEVKLEMMLETMLRDVRQAVP
jgi:hypothetical protein